MLVELQDKTILRSAPDRLAGRVALVASSAHELIELLTAISLNGAACLRWLERDPPDLDEVRTTVARVVTNARHAADIVAGIAGESQGEPHAEA